MKGQLNWKTWITILCLLACYPLGIVLVWILSPWKRDVKFLITSSVFIPLSFFAIPAFLPACKIASYLTLIASVTSIAVVVLILVTSLWTRKTTEKRALWIRTFYILGLIIAAGGTLLISGMQCFYRGKFDIKPAEQITLTTDKTEYEQGETVRIRVRNDLDKSIWYIKEMCPSSCCNVYKWENNQWKNLGDPMPCIQLVRPPGGSYSIEADELKPGESVSKQWNMKIGIDFVESGKYRFSFYYGLSKGSYTENTIYSNEFRIEEKPKVEKSCDEKCKNLGYLSGACRKYAISPQGMAEKCQVGEVNVEGVADCKLQPMVVGVGITCCCIKK